MQTITLQPIGIIQNAIEHPQDDHWGAVISTLTLDAQQFTQEALAGIEEFSHLEVIYFMHQVAPESIPAGARHPRNLTHLPKVGIFAQRPKARPNRLGLSRCELLQRQGLVLTVRGLDAINQTPVLDIKPYFAEFMARGAVRQPAWTQEILQAYF
ncbi:SAM-dependent methyltransferase [Massilia sp. W12]|uniref:SAM-dependent methyltransferase n=1 Tax=Massilia sp. W12 TaxID=3126507 RepID=UPI0030D54E36